MSTRHAASPARAGRPDPAGRGPRPERSGSGRPVRGNRRPEGRGPLVIDTRPLGRRPGSLWEGRRTAPAPGGLGWDLARVPAGAELAIDLRLESALDGVLVTATLIAPLDVECSRCLLAVRDTLEVAFTELWSYPEQAERHAQTAGSGGATDDDLDDLVHHLDGDLLDLEPAVRDAVVLALPTRPLCRDDCGGLCVECGERLDDLAPQHAHHTNDPRWDVLRGLDTPPAAPTQED